jgi:preprotein translocase subunit SecY
MKSELARRIAFTLGALLIYRLGAHIPLPGISSSGDRFVGVSGARFSIFALSILPYLSAAILIQLVSMVSSKLGALPGSGEAGRRKIARYTLGLAILLTAFQAFGVAGALQSVPNFVSEPGAFFLLSTTLTLTGGTMFLVWLSEQITERGIGNGLALMLFAGAVTRTPQEVASVLELTRQGALSVERAWLLALFWVALVGLVVFVELSRRRLPVEFAARTLGQRLLPAQSSYLSIKLNSSGVIPSVVAPWFYLLPLSIAGFAFGWTSPWLVAAYTQMAPGHIGHMILGSVAIVILAFIYTAYVVDPEHVAASLKKYGGVIPQIEPGEPTAEHVDRVVSYTTCVGAVYLAAVFLIPEVLLSYSQLPFYLDGSSVLIVVCTILDIEKQVRGQSLTEPGGAYR